MTNTWQYKQSSTVDPIMALLEQYNADRRQEKLNLGIGVYQTGTGETPVMSAVKKAEALLLEQEQTKTYVGVAGRIGFIDALSAALFPDLAGNTAGVQTVGGSGALRIIGDFCARVSNNKRLWLPNPTWANHKAIFGASGLQMLSFSYPTSTSDMQPSIEKMLADLQGIESGDCVLLHATCHNPTGIDLSEDSLSALIALLKEKDAVPILDAAYIGFKDNFEQDAALLARIMDAFEMSLCAFSASKNFALYRERVGAAFICDKNKSRLAGWRSEMMSLARSNYSMPPDHGAALVEMILKDTGLNAEWRNELSQMQGRISDLRNRLAGELESAGFGFPTDYIRQGSGMFCVLPISPDNISKIRESAGIYLVPNGRINIAGLSEDAVSTVAQTICSVIQK